MGVVRKVLEQSRRLVEPTLQVIRRVEADPIRGEHREVLDHAEGQVAFGAGWRRVGELVFVHVEHSRNRRQLPAQQREERGQVDHAGGEQKIGAFAGREQGARLLGQLERAAVHPPLPEGARHAQDAHTMAAMRCISFGPGAVRAGVVGVEEPDGQRAFHAAMIAWPFTLGKRIRCMLYGAIMMPSGDAGKSFSFGSMRKEEGGDVTASYPHTRHASHRVCGQSP